VTTVWGKRGAKQTWRRERGKRARQRMKQAQDCGSGKKANMARVQGVDKTREAEDKNQKRARKNERRPSVASPKTQNTHRLVALRKNRGEIEIGEAIEGKRNRDPKQKKRKKKKSHQVAVIPRMEKGRPNTRRQQQKVSKK